MAIKTAAEIIYALQKSTPASPFHQLGDDIIRPLEKSGVIYLKSLPAKEDKEQQTSQIQPPFPVAALRVENIKPPKTNIIPLKYHIEKYVADCRVVKPNEKTATWVYESPVSTRNIIHNDMNDTPTYIPNPAPSTTPSNKYDYTQEMAPHIVPDDRQYHRYNTRSTRGYAQTIRKIIDDKKLSDATNCI